MRRGGGVLRIHMGVCGGGVQRICLGGGGQYLCGREASCVGVRV